MRILAAAILALLLSGCAHQLTVEPLVTGTLTTYKSIEEAEYTSLPPWRRRARDVRKVVLAAADPEVTDEIFVRENAPNDPVEVEAWLTRRRSANQRARAIELAWLSELDAENEKVAQSVCVGC